MERRSNCPVAIAIDLLGDRWTLLILRDMLLSGTFHFNDLLAAEERIAPNILSDRLRRLSQAGLIETRKDPKDGRKTINLPTERAIGLLPVILELGTWAATHFECTTAPDGAADDYRGNRDQRQVEAMERARDFIAERLSH
jgi:DNA-binding HxlR family transcriptional regulator